MIKIDLLFVCFSLCLLLFIIKINSKETINSTTSSVINNKKFIDLLQENNPEEYQDLLRNMEIPNRCKNKISCITSEIINIDSNIIKIRLLENNKRILYTRFVDLIINSSSSRNIDINNVGDILLLHIIDVLKEVPFNAYFFECTPVSQNTKSIKYFEFVLIKSNELSTIIYDDRVFKSHFQTWDDKSNDVKLISVFENLGRDALLISPNPPSFDPSRLKQLNPQDYAHMSTFIKNGNDRQIKQFFKESIYHYNEILNTLPPSNNLWLSTNGLGVSWLHMRIDKSPKYYTYQDYLM